MRGLHDLKRLGETRLHSRPGYMHRLAFSPDMLMPDADSNAGKWATKRTTNLQSYENQATAVQVLETVEIVRAYPQRNGDGSPFSLVLEVLVSSWTPMLYSSIRRIGKPVLLNGLDIDVFMTDETTVILTGSGRVPKRIYDVVSNSVRVAAGTAPDSIAIESTVVDFTVLDNVVLTTVFRTKWPVLLQEFTKQLQRARDVYEEFRAAFHDRRFLHDMNSLSRLCASV
eukprot:1981689-Pleurochrysis_carterae.AAC.1